MYMLITRISFLFIQVACFIVKGSHSRKCFDDTEDTFKAREREMNITTMMTYSIRPGWYAALTDIEYIPSKYINIKQTSLYPDLHPSKKICRKGKGKKQWIPENTLNSLSQCPWRYVENTDTNRIPQTILETECLCKNPVNSRKKDNLVCQSVIEYINVYRKVDVEHGVGVFKRSWEPRSVACVASSVPKAQRKYVVLTKMPM